MQEYFRAIVGSVGPEGNGSMLKIDRCKVLRYRPEMNKRRSTDMFTVEQESKDLPIRVQHRPELQRCQVFVPPISPPLPKCVPTVHT